MARGTTHPPQQLADSFSCNTIYKIGNRGLNLMGIEEPHGLQERHWHPPIWEVSMQLLMEMVSSWQWVMELGRIRLSLLLQMGLLGLKELLGLQISSWM